MENYTYKNCFKLANSSNNINNYFYDASNSNQPIQNENDCANYAYYNNHPSFFFKKEEDNDISKCFVLKYDNIKSNNNDKETQINNITNLNYDLNNNKNLPRFNLKEEFDDTTGHAVYSTDCSKKPNTLKYYLMKSFSNSYDINYNKITKRDTGKGVSDSILNEYKAYITSKYPNKLSTFENKFERSPQTFNNLYISNSDNENYMYNEMILIFISQRLSLISYHGIPFSFGGYDNKALTNYIKPTTTTTEPSYPVFYNNLFKESFKMYPYYIGLPLGIYKQYAPPIPVDIIENNNSTIENLIHNYINIMFVIFVTYQARRQLKDSGKTPSYINLKKNHNYIRYSTYTFTPNPNTKKNYSFTLDHIYNVIDDNTAERLGDGTFKLLFEWNIELFNNQTTLQYTVDRFLYRLLSKEPIDHLTTNKTRDICNAMKKSLYPDIIDKFLSITDNNNAQNMKNIFSVDPTIINLFRQFYTGEYRLYIIDATFKDTHDILKYENELIKQDINNMKTYIDNIYLHSKLNNIENYIYNEKSKLKYLFNKNSSEKQKNDDLKFLNNFIFTENIIICIIIFILILFFIKK